MHKIAQRAAILLVFVLLAACAKPDFVRNEQRSAFSEAPGKSGHYRRQAALCIKPGHVQGASEAEDILLKTLSDAIRRQAQIAMTVPIDPDYPAFMKIYQPLNHRDIFAVTQIARGQGFHNLLQASVENIQVNQEKSGFWFLRKEKYYLTVVLSLDLYDTFTGAKLMGEVREKTKRIEPDIHSAIAAGAPQGVPMIHALITEIARDLGRSAAAAMLKSKWIASVAELRGQEVILKPGAAAGLRVGDRLALYEGRRTINGLENDQFFLPGYKVGEIRITTVGEDSAKGAAAAPADIQVGDVALPL